MPPRLRKTFWWPVIKGLEEVFVRLVCLAIRCYQLSFRIVLGPRCRFFPSCSEYATEAFTRHGLFRGGRLTMGRLCRCRPSGGFGLDPVPDALDAVAYTANLFSKK